MYTVNKMQSFFSRSQVSRKFNAALTQNTQELVLDLMKLNRVQSAWAIITTAPWIFDKKYLKASIELSMKLLLPDFLTHFLNIYSDKRADFFLEDSLNDFLKT